MPPPNKNVLARVEHLRQQDTWLEPMDLLIVSHALADPDSNYLFTTDKELLKSSTIKDFGENLRGGGKRNSELKIIDSLWRSYF